MKLNEIPRVKCISKEDFLKHYVIPQQPVVVEELTKDWPAYHKWNLSYIKQVAGDKTVPLYDDRPVNYKEKFNEPHAQMKMSAYIDLLLKKPTKYRIFLYNVMKQVPVLRQDFKYPNLGLRLLKGLPMLFFGGENSSVFMHYDIDLANILHFHFHGQKKCILFPQNQSRYLYKIPHSLISREDIDFDNPDLEKWPALAYAKGYTTVLNHGEMLYMPEGYWHYMKYTSPGFSMSLRALPRSFKNLRKACYNVLVMRNFDNFMRTFKGERWLQYKLDKAVTDTHVFMNPKGH